MAKIASRFGKGSLGVFCDFRAFMAFFGENSFQGKMTLKSRDLRDFCEEKMAKSRKRGKTTNPPGPSAVLECTSGRE